MSKQLNWPQVDSNQVVVTSQRWSKDIGCTLSSIWNVKGKGYEYICKWDIYFSNKLVTNSKNMFSLCHYGILCADGWERVLFNPFLIQALTQQHVEYVKGDEYFLKAIHWVLCSEFYAVWVETHSSTIDLFTLLYVALMWLTNWNRAYIPNDTLFPI